MKCTDHGADGCAGCRPALGAAWTVGQMKAALAAIPDDTPLAVNAVDPGDPDCADEQVIISAGFGTVDWGDGYGPEPDGIFGLNCELPEGYLRERPDRPWRKPGVAGQHTRPAGVPR